MVVENTKKMIIDDLIVLGRAAPDKIKNSERKTMCIGGYSKKHGFIRIYPTNYKCPLQRWNEVTIPVEKNNRDKRKESWKIQGAREEWENLYKKITVNRHPWLPEKYRRQFIKSLVTGCKDSLNTTHLSLGIIKPSELEFKFIERPIENGPTQTMLADFAPDIDYPFEHWVQTKEDFKFIPKLKYKCSQCKAPRNFHEQTIVDIGFYEFMRKYPNNLDKANDFAHVGDEDFDIYLLVGNQARHLTAYIIGTIFIFKKSKYPLIENFSIKDLPVMDKLENFF